MLSATASALSRTLSAAALMLSAAFSSWSEAMAFEVLSAIASRLSAVASMLSATMSALFSTAAASGDLLHAARVIRPAAATTKAIFFINLLPSNNVRGRPDRRREGLANKGCCTCVNRQIHLADRLCDGFPRIVARWDSVGLPSRARALMWRATAESSSIQPFLGAVPAMAVQYTYVMKGLTKTFPGANKPVLNNIHLQFLPSAKIAIIGPNG